MGLVITIALLGLLASVSPSTIIVFILLLTTVRARVNAAAFLIGWGISLTIVFAVSYAVGGVHVTQAGNGGIGVAALEILLGVALAVAAAQQWKHRDRPRTGSGVTKKFTARLKELKPWEAAAVGIFEQPWTLTAAAAVVLVRHHVAYFVVLFAFLVFAVLSTATVGVIFVYFARRPGQAEAHLSDLRNRLVQAGPAIFAIVSAAVGIFLVIDGIIGIVRS
jgi:Sap, sulfolipid-1-addressing protein